MSFKAAAWAIETPLVRTPYQRLVLIVLADCHNAETGRCDPSISFLAKRCMISPRTVNRAIAHLEQIGLVSRVHRATADGRKTSNSYQLHLDGATHHRAPDSRMAEGRNSVDTSPETRGAMDAPHSRMRRDGCVTQSLSDASHSRINQEEENQESEPVRTTTSSVPSRIPPADFKPSEMSVRQIRAKRPDVHIPTLLDVFLATEYPYPRTDWDRAFFKMALTQFQRSPATTGVGGGARVYSAAHKDFPKEPERPRAPADSETARRGLAEARALLGGKPK